MTPRSQLITERESDVAKDPIKAADQFFSANVGINKMLLVDRRDHLRGLVTASDVERITGETKSRRKPARDSQFRLVAGAALLPKRKADGSLDREAILSHVGNLVDEHVDAVAVSTAHGHTAGVGEVVRLVRGAFPSLTLIAGNVTSAAGVEFLADCGADAVKVGQGPGSICTTRIVAGVGIPQLTALFVASTRGQEARRPDPRRRGHHQVGRHREGAHPGRRRDLRRRAGRLPRGAGRDHGNRRKGLQAVPGDGFALGDEGGQRGALRQGPGRHPQGGGGGDRGPEGGQRLRWTRS